MLFYLDPNIFNYFKSVKDLRCCNMFEQLRQDGIKSPNNLKREQQGEKASLMCYAKLTSDTWC